ncbi:carbohydrate-binding protein [Streptomyces sp.]|uniref:carbohydrate-binding protein n=1 Tax=Streptomyces sp. TaxID=1931 RepID=UPI002F42C172
MTAGHDGTPENDDPFAYLYRSEGGDQPEPAGGGPRSPRTSYNQVQRVGERRPANPGPQQNPPRTGGYGYPQPQSYDQYGGGTQPYPQAQQQAPGTREYTRQPPGGGGHRGGHQSGGGPDARSRKGLLIAAVAVVAAVAIGIAFAMTNGSGDTKEKTADPKPTPTAQVTTTAPSTEPTPSATATPFASSKMDASKLALVGGAQQSTQWPGANAAGGMYVDHLSGVGASVEWRVTVPEDGAYTFFISYGNAGDDATLTLGVNGKPRSDAVNLMNYGDYTDWAKAWNNHTYSWVDLKKGENTLSLTCAPGNQCGVNLDQVWLKQGQVSD